jgi:AraC-like DNA-binding protein
MLFTSDLDRLPSEEWINLAFQARFKPIELAACCGTSLRKLERYFNMAFQQTPKLWLHDLRMRIAGQMLIQHKTQKEIAAALSFSNVPHFVREFGRFYGCSPTTYLRTQTVQSISRSTVSPEWRALEEEYRSALIHPRDKYGLLLAHRKRLQTLTESVDDAA